MLSPSGPLNGDAKDCVSSYSDSSSIRIVCPAPWGRYNAAVVNVVAVNAEAVAVSVAAVDGVAMGN